MAAIWAPGVTLLPRRRRHGTGRASDRLKGKRFLVGWTLRGQWGFGITLGYEDLTLGEGCRPRLGQSRSNRVVADRVRAARQDGLRWRSKP
jgi:hypothetical protein